jgi:hypothetical protein
LRRGGAGEGEERRDGAEQSFEQDATPGFVLWLWKQAGRLYQSGATARKPVTAEERPAPVFSG